MADFATGLARIVASAFDPAHLNAEALVVNPDLDVVLELRGWDGEAQAWECSNPTTGETFRFGEIADAYMVRRVMWHVSGRPGAVFPHLGESAPMFQDLVMELAARVDEELASELALSGWGKP